MGSPSTIDLHCHSVFSDGTLTPETLVEQAARQGLKAFALTDHDTVGGWERAMTVAERLSVPMVPGIEISATCGDIGVHILGYLFDPEDNALRDALTDMRANRVRRIERMTARLREAGLELSAEDVFQEGASGTWGRPHLARTMVRLKLVRSFDEAFRKYLGNDGPAYVARDEMTAAEAIEIIHSAGGVAVLAHPLSYRHPRLSRTIVAQQLLDSLKKVGLDGMEVAYSNCSSSDSGWLMSQARRRGLAFSGGSDYHGTATPRVSIGIGRGNLKVPTLWLRELLERRPNRQPASWSAQLGL